MLPSPEQRLLQVEQAGEDAEWDEELVGGLRWPGQEDKLSQEKSKTNGKSISKVFEGTCRPAFRQTWDFQVPPEAPTVPGSVCLIAG